MSSAYLHRFGPTAVLSVSLSLMMPAGMLWAGVTQAELQRCAGLADDSARLDCFDMLVSKSASATAAESPTQDQPNLERQLAAEQQKAQRLQEELEAARLERLEDEEARTNALLNPSQEMMLAAFGAENLPPHQQPPLPAKKIDQIEAGVLGITRLNNGWIQVRLDNGQSWEQISSARDLGLREDSRQTVIIKRGWLSDTRYSMRNPANNHIIPVQRIE